MRKRISILLALLIVLSITACGTQQDSSVADDVPSIIVDVDSEDDKIAAADKLSEKLQSIDSNLALDKQKAIEQNMVIIEAIQDDVAPNTIQMVIKLLPDILPDEYADAKCSIVYGDNITIQPAEDYISIDFAGFSSFWGIRVDLSDIQQLFQQVDPSGSYDNLKNPYIDNNYSTTGNGKELLKYGLIYLDYDAFKKMTEAQYIDFCTNVIDSRADKYNWLTLVFVGNSKQGYGLSYPGCSSIYADFGRVDGEGIVQKTEGTIWNLDGQIENDIFDFQTEPLDDAQSDSEEVRYLLDPTSQQLFYAPDNQFFPVDGIIFSTTGEENDLGDTGMYASGTLGDSVTKNGSTMIPLVTDAGTIWLTEAIGIDMPSDLISGTYARIYFVYLGWSSVLDGPAGVYIDYE